MVQHNTLTQLSFANTALINGIDLLNLFQTNVERNHFGRFLDLVYTNDTNLEVENCDVSVS